MQNDLVAAEPEPTAREQGRWDDPPPLLWRPILAVRTLEPAALELVGAPERRSGTELDALLRRAATDGREWAVRGAPTTVMVAVPPGRSSRARSTGECGLVSAVAAALDRTGLDPARLVIEVPLPMICTNPIWSPAALWRLRASGVSLALDGTTDGCAALSTAAVLPFNLLRLARQFLARADHGSDGRALREAMASVHGRRVALVADGIETEAQVRRLGELGVSYASGSFSGRPASAPSSSAAAATCTPWRSKKRVMGAGI